MQITVFGATGKVGSRVVAEAQDRGHDVIAVARDPFSRNELPEGIDLHRGDVSSVEDVVSLTEGRDAVVNATRSTSSTDAVHNTRALLKGVALTGTRLLTVGGAASLVVPGTSGQTVLDDARYLSPSARHIGEVSLVQHRAHIEDQTVNWAYLSPPANLFPGSRTGSYRLGTNELLVDAEGRSQISMEDLAVVLLDEAEHPRHHRTQFTAAY